MKECVDKKILDKFGESFLEKLCFFAGVLEVDEDFSEILGYWECEHIGGLVLLPVDTVQAPALGTTDEYERELIAGAEDGILY